jgi:hypothetical protein
VGDFFVFGCVAVCLGEAAPLTRVVLQHRLLIGGGDSAGPPRRRLERITLATTHGREVLVGAAAIGGVRL